MDQIQDYKLVGTIRAAAILTDAYVAATVIDNAEIYNQLMLDVRYTKGSLTSLQLKVEFSLDGATYTQETTESISGGTITETAVERTFVPSGNQNFLIAVPIKCNKIKVSAKGTGTVTSSSLTLVAALAVA